MSAGTKMPYREVLPVANEIIGKLGPYCERIALAGSLRRQRAQVGDIEIVALPKRPTDLFGNVDMRGPTVLDMFLAERGVTLIKDGGLYKQFRYGRFMTDLFLPASADHWGCIFLLRTGSHEFNMWLLEEARRKGMGFHHGRLIQSLVGQVLETPEEEDVFAALGIPFVQPHLRDHEAWLLEEGEAIGIG